MGVAVTGEMGAAKREIVYLGDVLNTASRIQAYAREVDHDILASADVIDRLHVPSTIQVQSLGPAVLRGKSKPVSLFSVAANS